MEISSHLIETRDFVDKCLVCDIVVKDVSYTAVGHNVRTNKWLHMENWLEFNQAIDGLLNPYRECKSLDGFDADVFHLNGSIRVDCKRIRMSRAYKQILGKDKEYLPVALGILVTRIDTKALIEQIAQLEQESKQVVQVASTTTKSGRKHDSREYDPTLNNSVDPATLEYVPYTASVKQNGISMSDIAECDIHENEPYSPKPLIAVVESSPDQIAESPNEVPTYRPGRIALSTETTNLHNNNEDNDQQNEEQLPSPKVLRRRRLPIPEIRLENPNVPKELPASRPTNAELFGSDDSDQEPCAYNFEALPQIATSPKRVATPIRTPNTSDRLHQEIKRKRSKLRHESATKSPLDGWLSKGSSRRGDRMRDRSSKKSSRHAPIEERRIESSSKKESGDVIKNRNIDELQQIKELSALRETIKSKRKSPPPEMEILNLTHLSLEDILSTFEGCRPILDDIFKTLSKKTKVTGFDGINHMKTLMLIDDKTQLQMMSFLRENYQPHEKGVPSLTDLYINALVPEWTVNVFMKEYNFTRTEAIKRLQAQEDSSVHHIKEEGLDTSGPL